MLHWGVGAETVRRIVGTRKGAFISFLFPVSLGALLCLALADGVCVGDDLGGIKLHLDFAVGGPHRKITVRGWCVAVLLPE